MIKAYNNAIGAHNRRIPAYSGLQPTLFEHLPDALQARAEAAIVAFAKQNKPSRKRAKARPT